MKLFIENDIDVNFDFDYEEIAKDVIEETLNVEACPFECEINILITDNETIHEINKETREIDRPTDVLSFPNLYFDEPSNFSITKEEMADYIDPETELIVLGEMILSYDKILEQAKDYGHSIKREYAFLIAHSMLHLCGYDHMTEDEACIMEQKQKIILSKLGITRD